MLALESRRVATTPIRSAAKVESKSLARAPQERRVASRLSEERNSKGPITKANPLKRERTARGFSLIEVMIAIAILGLIGGLTYGTFARAMDARDRASAITEHYHQVRQAMQRMSREISMAYLSEYKNCEEPRNQTIFIGKRAGNGMRIDFTSFSHTRVMKDANEADTNELAFYVERDPDDPKKLVLMRREQAPIDDEPEEGGTADVLAENVTDLNFEFYNPTDDSWEDEWDTTNSEYRGRLPMFVRIELTAINQDGKEEKFVTKTRVFMKKTILIPGSGFVRCVD